MADRSGFLKELKRRHVWRVAAAYAVVAWLLVQLASIVFPAFGTPPWVLRTVIALLAIGFPVVVALAWAFELTPEGVRRTEPAQSPDARAMRDTHAIGRKLNTVIITVLVLAVALLGWRLVVLRHAPAPTAETTVRSPDAVKRNPGAVAPDSATDAAAFGLRGTGVQAVPIPAKSVAVLPFANEGGDKGEQFFSDGLSDDLITALSQFDGLKVINRYSAFQFRDSKDSIKVIGQKLGVAHLLEGSVQRAGDEVRITATLVDASDGRILWSERYDKPYKDLFALQDAITQAVAGALKAKLPTAPGAVLQSDRPPGGNLDAYTAYQHGIAYRALGTEAGFRQAIDAYHEAIRLDPKYAAAHAQLSMTWTGMAIQFVSGAADIAQAKAATRQASATALRLDPDSSLAHQARAYLLQDLDMDWTGGEAERRRALQLSPNDAAAQYGLGRVLAALGQNRRAVELTRQALASDPRHATWYNWLHVYLTALGELDEARQTMGTALALQPDAPSYHEQLAILAILRGEPTSALTAAQQEPPGPWRDFALALSLQVGPDRAAADAALAKLIRVYPNFAPYQIAEVYALRKDPDHLFEWLDHAWTSRDSGIALLLSDPLILRYRHDPRFDAFCKKAGLPATTDAVAMK